jgi:hypothetical protein
MGQLMSVVHLQMRLIFGLVLLLVVQLDCQLQGVGVLRVLVLMLGSCKSRMLGLHSRYIHSFSIIDDLWFLLLVLGCLFCLLYIGFVGMGEQL